MKKELDELEYLLDDVKESAWQLANDEREELMTELKRYCSEDYWDKYGGKE